MIKQIFLPIILVCLFIAAVGFYIKKNPTIVLPGATPKAEVQLLKSLKIGSKDVFFEVANTESLRAKGLGSRPSLEPDNGMLFVFDKQNVIPTFWMKDMQIPIDIIWINDDKVVSIDKNIPAPSVGTPDSKLSLYNPGQPVDYVLEVNSGFTDKNDIKVGDAVVLPTL